MMLAVHSCRRLNGPINSFNNLIAGLCLNLIAGLYLLFLNSGKTT